MFFGHFLSIGLCFWLCVWLFVGAKNHGSLKLLPLSRPSHPCRCQGTPKRRTAASKSARPPAVRCSKLPRRSTAATALRVATGCGYVVWWNHFVVLCNPSLFVWMIGTQSTPSRLQIIFRHDEMMNAFLLQVNSADCPSFCRWTCHHFAAAPGMCRAAARQQPPLRMPPQGGVWILEGQVLGVGHGLEAWGTCLEEKDMRRVGMLAIVCLFFSIASILEHQSETRVCLWSFQMSAVSWWSRRIWWFLWERTHLKLGCSNSPSHPMFNHPVETAISSASCASFSCLSNSSKVCHCSHSAEYFLGGFPVKTKALLSVWQKKPNNSVSGGPYYHSHTTSRGCLSWIPHWKPSGMPSSPQISCPNIPSLLRSNAQHGPLRPRWAFVLSLPASAGHPRSPWAPKKYQEPLKATVSLIKPWWKLAPDAWTVSWFCNWLNIHPTIHPTDVSPLQATSESPSGPDRENYPNPDLRRTQRMIWDWAVPGGPLGWFRCVNGRCLASFKMQHHSISIT